MSLGNIPETPRTAKHYFIEGFKHILPIGLPGVRLKTLTEINLGSIALRVISCIELDPIPPKLI